jgi:5-methyltetrahydropteroyltriglutamate--homocysteine methyltransferase
VDHVVAQQVASGVDIVSDGEMSKPSYATYIKNRVEGIEPDPRAAEKGRDIMVGRDLLAHPDFAARLRNNFSDMPFPACVGPLRYRDESALKRDLSNLKAAVGKARPAEAFMTAASPGILTRFVINLHYPTEDDYVDALAGVMRTEYRAIVEAGFILQIDAPDLGSARNNQYRHLSDAEFRKIAERNIAALNAATEGLPPDRMRLHICWGNYPGPHTFDLPLTQIADIAFKARPQALSIEASNPRHEHEWEDLKDMKIPDDKVLIPGLIDSTSNFVEHPKLVAQRIARYADIVGRERVIAGVDCGFGTAVRADPMIADSIVWAKLKSLAEGAQIASTRLWG